MPAIKSCSESADFKGLQLIIQPDTYGNLDVDYSKARKGPQIMAAMAAALGALLFGTNLGWSSPVQPQLQRNVTADSNTSSIWQLELDGEQMSWTSSLVNIGTLIGSLSGGFFMDRFGRRTTLIAVAFPFIIGWLLITFAIHISMLYVGRITCGICAGICSATIPTYISEVATPAVRGTVGMFFTIGLCSGALFASVLVWLDWRWISGILSIPPVFLFIAMQFVPESPYFLVKHDRSIEARKALRWLRGPDYNVQVELDRFEARNRAERETTIQYSDLMSSWAIKPILIGVTMMIFQQFSGLNVAQFYSLSIFEMAGSSLNPRVGVMLLNCLQLLSVTFASAVLVGRLGRKTMFVMSETLCALSISVLGGYFYISEHDPKTASSLSWLPPIALLVFMASVQLGVAPLAWLVSNEVLTGKLKGPGSSIAAFVNGLSTFAVTKSYVDLREALTTAGTFWFYGGFCVLGTLFGLFLMPETKGKTPEQIEAMFKGKRGGRAGRPSDA